MWQISGRNRAWRRVIVDAIGSFETQFVQGLFQTEDYARAVLSTWRRDSPDEVEAKVAIRLGRQAVLASADFRVLLDESVLHRRIGAPEVTGMQLYCMQLARLEEVAEPRKEWTLEFIIGAAPRSSSARAIRLPAAVT